MASVDTEGLTVPDANRLKRAQEFGATSVVDSAAEDAVMQAYDTFADAARTSALKVFLNGRGPN